MEASQNCTTTLKNVPTPALAEQDDTTLTQTKPVTAHKQKQCKVTFCITADLLPGQHIRVLGSADHLGWNYEQGLELIPSEPDGASLREWTGSIILPPHSTVEYKYVVFNSKTLCYSLSAIRRLVTRKSSLLLDDGEFQSHTQYMDTQHNKLPYRLNIQLALPSSYSPKPGQPRLGIKFQTGEQPLNVRICTRDSASNLVEEVLLHEFHEVTTFNFAQSADLKSLHFEVTSTQTTSRSVVLISQLDSSHHGVVSAPLMDSSFMVIGEITFRYVLVSPFSHPRIAHSTLPLARMEMPKAPSSSTLLIGHRGTGAEGARELVEGKRRSHIRENTVLSFSTAGAHGAQLVEFDVHLTSDLVPVIYHDFSTHIRDNSIPIHSLSYGKFIEMGKRAVVKTTSLEDLKQYTSPLGPIHDDFPTLREVLQKVPINTGFNVEIKYPIDDEVQRYDVHPVNRNTYLDCILWEIYEHAKDRFIVFSSFDPDICSMLMAKQPHYPVFFLTQLGTEVRSDPRSNSVDASIHFAQSIGLSGLVCPARHLIEHQDVVQRIKHSGLKVWTWGRDNNIPENVHLQQTLGVDGIIADHVKHVAKKWLPHA